MIIKNLRACILNDLRIIALGTLLIRNQQSVTRVSIRLVTTHLFSYLQTFSEYLGGRFADVGVSFDRLTLLLLLCLLLCIGRDVWLLFLQTAHVIVLIGNCLGVLRQLSLLVKLD